MLLALALALLSTLIKSFFLQTTVIICSLFDTITTLQSATSLRLLAKLEGFPSASTITRHLQDAMESYTQTQWPAWAYNGVAEPMPGYSQMPDYPTYLADSMDAAYQSHQQHLVHHHQMSRTTESKPRLSKEEVEILEAEFQKNHKPNSNTKKALADSMRVENARINVCILFLLSCLRH